MLAARLLSVEYEAIEFVYVADNYVLVGMFNTSAKLDKKTFIDMFVSDRQARSKSLTATKNVSLPTQYTVRNEESGNRYIVQVKPDSIRCECADYHKQMEALGYGCCKHGYAVLGQLGYSSLGDYIKTMQNLSSTLCSTGLRGLYPKYDSYDALKAEARM